MQQRTTALLKIVGAVVLVVFLLWVGLTSGARDEVLALVDTLGYTGMFIGATISGFNLIAPVPLIALLPLFLAANFSFVPSVVVIALGMTTGDLLGYLLGDAGREVFSERERPSGRIINILEQFKETHPLLPYVLLFFYVAFAPLPNELIVIPMAFLGYRFSFMLAPILLGNLIFNTLFGLVITGIIG